MKELLYIDCTMHPGSRTALLAEAFFDAMDKTKFHVTTLDLDAMDLEPLRNESFRTRQLLLTRPERDHPRFDLAKQFAAADIIVIAAPYWDMSFPSLLKVYIEQVCVDGETFATTETGLLGLCRAEQMIYQNISYLSHPIDPGNGLRRQRRLDLRLTEDHDTCRLDIQPRSAGLYLA